VKAEGKKDQDKVQCKKCLEHKTQREFTKDKSRKSGYHPYCRICQNKTKNNSKALERATTWNRNNPEKRSKINKKWHDKNPDKNRIYKSERRSRSKKLSDGTITARNLRLLPKEICGICNKPLDWSDKSKIHLDHIIPLIKGGLNSINNVQWAHAKCNLSKGSK
jgi:hypothetical protein